MTTPCTRSRRFCALVAALAAALLVGSCGDDGSPVEVRLKEDTAKQTVLGFPALATKNTTRVGGKDPVADAAGAASAVFPGQHPDVVSLVDKDDWRAGIAASALVASPLRAPVLLADEDGVPEATAEGLDALAPRGSAKLRGVQVVRIGDVAKPSGLRAATIAGSDPFTLADRIDAFQTTAAGSPSQSVVIVSADDPDFAMPAAAWAAKSGDPVLFTRRDVLPAPTRRAVDRHEQPSIFVLGPPSVISEAVVRKLARLGTVKRIAGKAPVENAIAFARYSDESFGWGVKDPGHGLVIANIDRPLDAAAGAVLSSTGTYGPLLLIESSSSIPPPLEGYLLDIQPGYRFDPVRGVYNHAWLMGDESAISVGVQGRIDSLAEITQVKQGGRS
jgi:putative cell wall binding repeat protein